jgi:hypothetical protein
MNMQTRQPARDAEHFHNPAAAPVPRPAAGAILLARQRDNLRFALAQFDQQGLTVELARAVQDVTGSKGKAFNVLDMAIKEVMK